MWNATRNMSGDEGAKGMVALQTETMRRTHWMKKVGADAYRETLFTWGRMVGFHSGGEVAALAAMGR